MPRGIPFKPEENDVIDAIKKTRGNLASTAKLLGITRECINNYLEDKPHLWEIVKKQRNHRDVDSVQSALDTIFYFMGQREAKPRLSYDAARFIVERKGHLLDWADNNHVASKEDKLKGQLEELNQRTDDDYKEIIDESSSLQ